MIKRAVAISIFVFLTAAAFSFAEELQPPRTKGYILAPVTSSWGEGKRGVFKKSDKFSLSAGTEYAVIRGGRFIGLFSVNDIGSLNVWGAFEPGEKDVALEKGDLIAVPENKLTRSAPRKSLKRPVASLVFCLSQEPGPVWCVIDRGKADGVLSDEVAAVFKGTEKVAVFYMRLAGERWSYGELSATDRIAPDAASALVVRFAD